MEINAGTESSHNVRDWLTWMAVFLLLGVNPVARATEAVPLPAPEVAGTPAATVSFGKRLLWYVPNRFMDLLDVFRFRVRIGPGLAAGMRVTDFGSFYFGHYTSIYAGLPGPRNTQSVRLPVGAESLKGVVFCGVDATDDTPYGPAYGPTEVDVGVHLGVVGVDAGLDPLEFSDFLSGFFFFDLKRDDYPRPRTPLTVLSSGVTRRTEQGMFGLGEKPDTFHDFTARLDYLHTNIHQRISKPIRTIDEYFAPDALGRDAVIPHSRLRLGVYAETFRGETRTYRLEPDADLDVALPNMENRLHVFAQTGHADDLPGLPLSETKDQSLLVGARRLLKHSSISADLGARIKLHPRAFARVTWHPRYDAGPWSFRPQQRFFLDSNDRLGSLSTVYVDRWLGDGHQYYAGSTTSAKYTQDSREWRWEQSLRLGQVFELIEKKPYLGRFGRRDILSGNDINAHVFGDESGVSTYRLTAGLQRPLYQKWIIGRIEPGLEWTESNNHRTAYRITVGVDMMFWGPSTPAR
jgi:hypothetical protein